jgi:branched-chain amino acid transport system substrate-binding protein
VWFVVGLSAACVNEVWARGVIHVDQPIGPDQRSQDFSKYTFHEAMNPHMTTGPVGRYVFPKHGKRIAFLIADYAFGHELTRGLKREGKQHGIEVVAEVKHPIAAKDFSAFLPQIQAAKPDVLFLCNFGYDQLNSIKQAIEFGSKHYAAHRPGAVVHLVGGAAYDG